MIGIFAVLLLIGAGWRLLTERRPKLYVANVPLLTRTLIICGDCGLNPDGSSLPVKTRLTTKGECNGCGGRSFVLASKLAPVVAQAIKRERSIPEYSDMRPTKPETERIKV